jgi:predicted phage tail protein
VDEELQKTWVPEGYPNELAKKEHVYNEDRSLLARQCVVDIINELDAQKSNGFLQSKGARSIVLDGLAGSGKSVALLHAILWARSSGWLVLYIPSGMFLIFLF